MNACGGVWGIGAVTGAVKGNGGSVKSWRIGEEEDGDSYTNIDLSMVGMYVCPNDEATCPCRGSSCRPAVTVGVDYCPDHIKQQPTHQLQGRSASAQVRFSTSQYSEGAHCKVFF